MRSIKNIYKFPAGAPLIADEFTEFHAARIILLIHIAGKREKIEGLTKLAKLDFFIRYPAFFSLASGIPSLEENNSVESYMVRHHYGPWDKRYYQVLAYLESRNLITVTKKKGTTYIFALTDLGVETASELSSNNAFTQLCDQMGKVKEVLGSMSGTSLKRLVYELFDQEVAQLKLGEVIISDE